MEDAELFYSGLGFFLEAGREKDFIKLAAKTHRQRGLGDFYGFMLVAQGSGEVMVDYGVHPWDVAAIKPIVEEAGGRFSDWNGNSTIYRTDVLASNALLHDQTLGLLQETLP
jgi:histidinol-phosphatase